MARDRTATMREAETVVPGRHSTLADAHDCIERENEHLEAVIHRLLMLTHLESGVHLSVMIPVDLAELVRAIAIDADLEASPMCRVVSATVCEDCVIQGIPDLLRSAIENVVRNAVTAVIHVRDHGPGVPEKQL